MTHAIDCDMGDDCTCGEIARVADAPVGLLVTQGELELLIMSLDNLGGPFDDDGHGVMKLADRLRELRR